MKPAAMISPDSVCALWATGRVRRAAEVRMDARLGSHPDFRGLAPVAHRDARDAEVHAHRRAHVSPACGHWRVRRMYVWLGLLFWIAVCVSLVAFGDQIPKDAMGPVILCVIGGGLAWFISAGVLANNAIKPTQIRDRDMLLVNVHKDFATEWNEMLD